MFHTTFVTGKALIGTKMRDVTAYIDSDVTPPAVEYRTVKNAIVQIDKDTIWKTLANARKVAKHTVHNDGRFSGNGPAMYAVPLKNLTDSKGKIKGRTETTAKFILHMLAVSGEENWGLETKTDRANDAATLIGELHS